MSTPTGGTPGAHGRAPQQQHVVQQQGSRVATRAPVVNSRGSNARVSTGSRPQSGRQAAAAARPMQGVAPGRSQAGHKSSDGLIKLQQLCDTIAKATGTGTAARRSWTVACAWGRSCISGPGALVIVWEEEGWLGWSTKAVAVGLVSTHSRTRVSPAGAERLTSVRS